MKELITLVFLLFSLGSFCQNRDRMNEILEIANKQDSIPRELFLDSTMIQNMKLSHASNWRQIWTDVSDDNKSIEHFYDIRLKFNSQSDALTFHKKYMIENAENGPAIKRHKIKLDGVEELHVYTQNEALSKLFLEPKGLQALCYIFVVDDYFVKLYITCLKEYQPQYFIPYIQNVHEKIKKYSEQ